MTGVGAIRFFRSRSRRMAIQYYVFQSFLHIRKTAKNVKKNSGVVFNQESIVY